MNLLAAVFYGVLGLTVVGYLGYVLAPSAEDGNDLAEGEQRVPEQFRHGSEPESSVSPESEEMNRTDQGGSVGGG